jgi:myo-inositol 2-dehydrogenase/D-chiro-inositol 1-dehydrogenase
MLTGEREMDKDIIIGIIGAGRIGKLHAENLVKGNMGVRVKTIADIYMDEDIRSWAKDLGIPVVACNVEEIFDDAEINTVFICSSTNTHTEFIMRCAQTGKDIFCEKPIGSDLSEISSALAAVNKSGVNLQVGFVRRFDHNHKAVRDCVKSGRVGRPEIVKITSRDPEPPPVDYVKVSGGIFFDMMIHDFDMARYLAGSEVVSVFAAGSVMVSEEIGKAGDIDTAIVTLKFENGTIGVIDNSRRAAYGYDQRTEVHGALGCVKTENDTANLAMVSTASGVASEKPLWFFLERYNEAFLKEVRDFIDAIQGRREVSVTGEDAFKAVIIAEAATKSYQENRPVMISEIVC